MTFFRDLIRTLLDEGHTVDILCNETVEKVPDCYREWNCRIYHHTCSRSPFSKGNLSAVRWIREVVTKGEYDIVHCHTPIASICTRFACRKLRKTGLKVIYTAHGFHFYKGAPLKNWLLYYPVEKLCSRFTDLLITINHEDYDLAKRKMNAAHVAYVPGVGIDVDKFRNTVINRAEKRQELGVPADAFLLASVGELNANKNHEVIIRAMAQLQNDALHYVIAGIGPLEQHLTDLSRDLGLSDHVHLLGYRNDVPEIYKAADVCCFPSIREGLPVAVMEAMAVGLPIIAGNNRGTRDLLQHEKSGFLCKYNDLSAFSRSIEALFGNASLKNIMGKHAQNDVSKYSVSDANRYMQTIYQDLCALG